MLKSLLLVGTGGCIGSVLRYLTGLGVARLLPGAFPWGTLTVNIVGCLIMGLVLGSVPRDNDWKLLLATGLCGGFTTFSAFASENFELLNSGQYVQFTAYTLSSITIGIIALAGGLAIARFFFH